MTLLRLLAALAAAFILLDGQAAGAALPPAAPAWVYLRGGQPLQAGEILVTLAAVGDINLGREVRPEAAFGVVAPWLQASDLALANLECAILAPGQPAPTPTALPGALPLVAPPGAYRALAAAGIDLVSLANNHALDLGPAGLAAMAGQLKQVGITPVGAGADALAASQAVYLHLKGLRLAFLAFNAIPTPAGGETASPGWVAAAWDPAQAEAAVRQAAGQAEAVIVSIHWGVEYELHSGPAQRRMVERLQAAGAALVIGHHPHTAQEFSILEGAGQTGPTVVAYSLGNLVFDQSRGETRRGLALRAYFDQQGLRAVQALAVEAGPRPRWAVSSAELSAWLEARLPRQPQAYQCQGETCALSALAFGTDAGLFTAGQADLTGDGQSEQVTRSPQGRLAVSAAGRLLWESPPDWTVVDAALGDPEGDGRTDLLLALYKPDEQGVLRSHPFLVGYRQGLFRPLWGGSAVSDPILEVELGDLNQDGVQELIVLEQSRQGLGRALTVWRWHGWGFSLLWRSPYGRYEDLRFYPAGLERPALLRFFQIR